VCFHPLHPSPAEEEEMNTSDQGTTSTKRTSISRGISVTSNLEERHLTIEAKNYLDEDDYEESLEKLTFQSN
jgi:hydrocephalus-inducing protein